MNLFDSSRRGLYKTKTEAIKELLAERGLIICKSAEDDYCYLVEDGHFDAKVEMPKGDLLILNNDAFYPHIDTHKRVLLVHGRRGKEKEVIGCFVSPKAMPRSKLLKITKG